MWCCLVSEPLLDAAVMMKEVKRIEIVRWRIGLRKGVGLDACITLPVVFR